MFDSCMLNVFVFTSADPVLASTDLSVFTSADLIFSLSGSVFANTNLVSSSKRTNTPLLLLHYSYFVPCKTIVAVHASNPTRFF